MNRTTHEEGTNKPKTHTLRQREPMLLGPERDSSRACITDSMDTVLVWKRRGVDVLKARVRQSGSQRPGVHPCTILGVMLRPSVMCTPRV